MLSVEEYLLKRVGILMDLDRRYPDKTELERLTLHLIETIKAERLKQQKVKEGGIGTVGSYVETAWQLYKLAGGKEDRLVTFMLNHKNYF